MQYNTFFSQLFQFIPLHRFEKSVETNGANRYSQHFTALCQILTCPYAQITRKDAIEKILDKRLAKQKKLNHLDMVPIAKSTLSAMMNHRSPPMFEALFNKLRADVSGSPSDTSSTLPLHYRQHDHPPLSCQHMTEHDIARTRELSSSSHR